MWCARSHPFHVRKILLVGCGILGFGIRNPSSTVPLTKNPESKTVLEYLTWDASHNKFCVLKINGFILMQV